MNGEDGLFADGAMPQNHLADECTILITELAPERSFPADFFGESLEALSAPCLQVLYVHARATIVLGTEFP